MTRRRTRAALVAIFVATAMAGVPAVAAAHVAVGIGDNNREIFTDPRFLALGIRYVRDDIAWNAVNVPVERANLAAWVAGAQADGLTPMITFDHVIGSVRTQRRLPTVAQFSRAFLKLRGLFPTVTEFETWDEANFYLEGTAFNPKRAAQYYLALRRDCPTCTIISLPGG